ncbi:uncharacterized protein LOC118457125 [Anopheles albimanus]|uniref:Uncharacterized protein n=1 Tax=Anopheles albimanus TaxID=7167 RepID=A0A182G014_ANOAL|nr:uncharacterized protein LOC118457125 [Anopheles albimanus]
MSRELSIALACVCYSLLALGNAQTETKPIILQYQEWFGQYAALGESTLQLKRIANSNATLTFNIVLVEMLANATDEFRRVDNTTKSMIEQTSFDNRVCKDLVLELYELFGRIGTSEMQACASYAAKELTYWTTQRFFSYANILQREMSELTHRVMGVLGEYNKVTQLDAIGTRLEDEYYEHNNLSNALQTVLNKELERLAPLNHPVRENLFDCLDTTVTLHQLDMEYVLSYVDNACGLGV